MGHLTDLLYHQFLARAATEQGGVISGDNPALYNASDPFRLWVIQVVIIIAFTRLLGLMLGRIRQPQVMAEVIGGVILGPTAMGRIPHFTTTIFPTQSIPLLNLTSTFGLVFYLFLVGLEIDTRVLKRNLTNSVAVSVAGLLIPLGLGAALGVGIYREFSSPNINFGHFLLFVAVAVGITAFPVLCRIMTELKLLDTSVGVVALSAGVGNDIVGWILLALTVALINASAGLTALWILLACTGYVIFLIFPIKWAYMWLARRTGSLERGSPTTMMMTITLFIVLISAFFTDIIGVHPVFGGFLAGLVIPHDNGYAISLVEKLEDLVSIILLPIYFTLSGLKTDLGLLNNGITWGYTILICVVAFSAKFIACGAAASWSGFGWRESGAIGSLMACKGLVELIVLNIGLQANILDQRLFSMFVVHAIILTFLTTPLTLLFYPAKYRVHESGASRSESVSQTSKDEFEGKVIDSDDAYKRRITVVLDRFEQLPAAMTLTQLLKANTPAQAPDEKTLLANHPPLSLSTSVEVLRLIELSERTSAVLKSTESEMVLSDDPLVAVFRTFGHLNSIPVLPSLSVVKYEEYPNAISEHVHRTGSQLVVVPWSSGHRMTATTHGTPRHEVHNPFDNTFHRTTSQDPTSSVVYSEYVRQVFLHAPVDVALFVDRATTSAKGTRHLLVPFFGGPDDRLALSFAVQLCMNKDARATVLRLTKVDPLSPLMTNATIVEPRKALLAGTQQADIIHQSIAAADTHYGEFTAQHRLISDTADNLLWDKYARRDTMNPAELDALSRIKFVTKSSPQLLHGLAEEANNIVNQGSELIIVFGRGRRLAMESHASELREIITERGSTIGSSVAKTLGDVGASLVVMNVHASLLVVQARKASN